MKLRALKHFIKSLMQTKKERRHALVGPADLWEMKRDFQIKFLQAMNLMPKDYLLDIGCGTLRGGLPLIAYLQAGHYFGLEAREEALNEGRKELREASLEEKSPVLFLSDDISQLTIDQSFNYIWAFSVLMHMNDKVLNDTLDFVSKHLSEDGVFYTNVNIGEMEEGNWQGFPVVARNFEFYIHMCTKNGLAVTDIGSLKDHGHISNVESQDGQKMLKIVKKR